MRPASLLFCLPLIAGWSVPSRAQIGTGRSDVLARSTQAIVVVTSDWNAVEGRLQRYQRGRIHGKWHRVGSPIPIVVGRSGLAWDIGAVAAVRRASDPVKKEGDGRSPAGVFSLGTAFGYSAQSLPGLKPPYLPLTASIECVDDPRSAQYNRIVDRSAFAAPDWHSSEHMRDAGKAYRWGIVVDYNGAAAGEKPIPEGGSCVFLHIWQSSDQGTSGCTAMPQSDLEALLTWLDPARGPLLVQLPKATYQRLAHRWRLPKLVDAQR